MKKSILSVILLAAVSALLTVLASAQGGSYATVQGTCKDGQGNLITDAQVVWLNENDGRTYKLKTDKKGHFFSLGIEPGQYTITLSKDGKVLDQQKGYHVGLDEVTYDIDLKQTQEQALKDTAKKQGVSTEEIKKQQEEQAKAEKYNTTVKSANDKLKAAGEMIKAQDYDKAIATLTEVTQIVPDQDVAWYQLGSAYLASTKSQTDAAEKTRRNTEGYNDLQKAIDLYKQRTGAGQTPAQGSTPTQGGTPPPAKPSGANAPDNVRLAVYYDNFGAAAAHLGKTQEAVNAYQQAAALDPSKAGDYYFKVGAVLTNSGTDQNARKQAAEAFDKAIAADPSKADAYYWKGSNLMGMASTDNSGKLVAPPGTAESFQKYLELQPSGGHAEEAKAMLAALNQTVETSFGTKKSTPKKK